MEEVASLTPLFAGVSYQRLEDTGRCNGLFTPMGLTTLLYAKTVRVSGR